MPTFKNVSSRHSGRVIGRGLLGLILLLSSLSAGFSQTTYYVAADGNDANTGRSVDTPLQSLAKVSRLSLQPGDAILFRRGDTFRGTLFVRQSGSADRPIVIDAYGSGNKPVLAGSVPVGNWTNVGNNVWQANCPECGDRVTGLYRDGAILPLSRYPNLSDANKGYLTVQSHNGNAQITSQQALSTNWTGGELVFRARQWIMNRVPITQQSGNTLTVSNGSNYGIIDGYGLFIQNHPAALDQTGEWYYNPANRTIQLYDSQNNPNGQLITATAFGEGVNLTNASYVTVRNLQITQTLTAGLSADGGSNLILSGNDITRSGFDGVSITGGGSNVLAENNLIEDANNNGFSIQPYQDFTFRGNTIRRAGVWPGRGQSGDGGYSGLQATCRANTVVENNTVDNVGYNGISFLNSATIRNNQVSGFCQTKSDGAGIYTWNGNHAAVSGIRILSNIIYNGIGAPEGTPGGAYSGANGIFLDDCSQNAEVTGNTTFGSRGKGIFLRGATNITLRDNTSFNNGEEQLMLAYNNTCALRNNVVQNNILVSRLPNQVVAAYESNANDLNEYGSFDYNYYARPFEDQFKIRAVYNPGSGITGADNTLAEWQARWGKDRNSFNSPLTYKTQAVGQTGASVLNHSFSDNANGWTGYSPHGNGRVERDDANRLDGGSLRLSFASASNQGDSYLLATVNIGSVTQGKTYQLLLDGVASAAGKRVQIFPRQLSAPYQDLAGRASYVFGTSRQSYEATFTATASESNAILVIQVQEDGQTAWFDNIRLQEATLTTLNPDDYIKLVYNPTTQDKTETLDGTYRDVKNNVYNRQVAVPAFTSLVLLKETNPTSPPPAPPTVTLREADNPPNTTAGLDYAYYEGNWNILPDFAALTPTQTGNTPAPTLALARRDDYFGLRYSGYLSVPTDGVYTFYTTSDDGSKLFIGATEVVNNDGGHADQERAGSIGLKAGLHALSIPYFETYGGQTLSVSYAGPNIGKQIIPQASYRRVSVGGGGPPAGSGTGLRAEYFNNAELGGGAVVSRVEAGVDWDWGDGSPVGGVGRDDFSVRWSGWVEAPLSGGYVFSTVSDDGVRLWVNGVLLIDNWTGHPPTGNSGTLLSLVGGERYAIRLEYFELGGGAVSRLLWSYGGQGQQVVPPGRLYPAPASGSGRVAVGDADAFDTDGTVQVYPMPSREEVRVRYYAETAGEVALQLVNTAAHPVMQQVHPVVRGENLIRVPVRDLPRGMYVMTLIQNRQRLSRKVLLAE